MLQVEFQFYLFVYLDIFVYNSESHYVKMVEFFKANLLFCLDVYYYLKYFMKCIYSLPCFLNSLLHSQVLTNLFYLIIKTYQNLPIPLLL